MNRTNSFLLLCAVGGFAIFSSTIAKNPVLPILAREIGANQALIGLIAAASTVTGIVTSLPAGLLSDRAGRRPVLIASGVVFFTAPLLYLLIRAPWQLALVRVYHGLATAVFGPVAMAYVADLAPTRRGERLGYYTSTTLAGRAIAPSVGGAILTLGAWQGVYVACAIAGFLALIGMLLLPDTQSREAKTEAASEQRASLGSIMRNGAILVTSVAEAAQFLAFGALEAFLPLYALSHGISKMAVGLLFTVQIGVRTLARPLMGKLSDEHAHPARFGAHRGLDGALHPDRLLAATPGPLGRLWAGPIHRLGGHLGLRGRLGAGGGSRRCPGLYEHNHGRWPDYRAHPAGSSAVPGLPARPCRGGVVPDRLCRDRRPGPRGHPAIRAGDHSLSSQSGRTAHNCRYLAVTRWLPAEVRRVLHDVS